MCRHVLASRSDHVPSVPHRSFVLALTLVQAVVAAACVQLDSPRSTGDEYLDEAAEVGQWLLSHSPQGDGFGIPDRVVSAETGAGIEADAITAHSAGLGSGAAGRAIFFAELFAASGDRRFAEAAGASAREAIERTEAQPSEPRAFGLYGGLAGVAAAATEVARVTGDDPLRDRARALFRTVAAGGPQAAGGVYDVLAGQAGIGLSLLYAFEQFADPLLLSAAAELGDSLLLNALDTEGGGLRWLRGAETPLDLPNFSHGTAGVGFFMARLSRLTGEERFLDGALRASLYLDEIADRSDDLLLIPYGVPNDEYATAYDIGWAHGPAGTARLHYELLLLTAEPGMRTRVQAGVRTLLASNLPGPSADPVRWSDPFPMDRRFGSSGAAALLSDWSLIVGDEEAAQRADRVARLVLESGQRSPDGLYWRMPLYGFQGEGEGVFTGYFYGAAGLGLLLLQRHHALAGRFPEVRLPDDPFPRGGAAGAGPVDEVQSIRPAPTG